MKSEPFPPTLKIMQIDRKEWRFVWLVALVLLVLTSLPYLYAEFSAPPDKHFMGFILNVSDHAQYLSWYKAFQSEGLISNRLTSEPNPAIFFNLLWWLMAQVGKLTGLSYIWMYQILRFVSGLAFFSMVYWFIARVFPEKIQRRIVFLLLAVSSGFGWVLVLLKYTLLNGTMAFPLDLYVAEGNTFLCLMAYPHFLEAGAFILGTLALLLVGEEKRRLRWAVAAGLVAFLLGWQHGYDLLIVWSIPICYAIARWLLDCRFPIYWFKAMLITGLISSPPAIYNILLTRLDPTWSEVLSQFANAGVYTPNLLHFFILLGLPLLIALITAVVIFVKAIGQHWHDLRANPVILFLLIWFIFGWLLTYIPTDFQIHMINSWQVPVILLAGFGLFSWVFPWLQKHFPNKRIVYRVAGLLIAFCAVTNLYLFAWRFYDLHRYDYPFFLHKYEVSALNWLEENTPDDSIVLSNLEVGQYIPGISGRTAFLAHWAQTIRYYKKQEIVAEIFGDKLADAEKMKLLQNYDVDYVLKGPAEQSADGAESMPLSFLTLVWTSGEVTIYAIDVKPTGALP